jgi:DNA-binding transcriptional MocR family regulator
METTRISAGTLARRLGPPPPDQGLPAYRVLADRIRAAVLDGRLTVSTGLPSERELAAGLQLSRTTVGAAYGLLREQGWLDSRRGSGSRLRLPGAPGGETGWAGAARGGSAAGRRGGAGPGGAGSGGAGSGGAGIGRAGSDVAPRGARFSAGSGPDIGGRPPAGQLDSFGAAGLFGWQPGIGWPSEDANGSGGVIDLTTASLPAPADEITRALAAAAEQLPRYLTGTGYLPFGLPVLRDTIAARYTAAGLPTSAEQILVTSGAQHAFTLVLGELSAPGDRVLIECPTYPVALDALRAQRRVPAPVGMGDNTDNAWDVELFAATMRQIAPRLGYLIPDFQNPTGALMQEQTRQDIVAAARNARTLLLSDESFRDVPFPGGAPIPAPLAAFDSDTGGTSVVSLGSVSKSFWGGLRVGWIRAAPHLIQRLAAARALGDMAGPVLDQLLVTELLGDPEPALTVQRSRLATGAAALQSALAEKLPEWQATTPQGGTFLWVKLPGPFATDLALLAPSVGVRIAPGPRFGPDGTMASYLRLPFSASPERLMTAVSRLATIAPQAAAGARSSLPGWLA